MEESGARLVGDLVMTKINQNETRGAKFHHI
jgi:hypothetical protein